MANYGGRQFGARVGDGWEGARTDRSVLRVGVFVDLPNLTSAAKAAGLRFQPEALYRAAQTLGRVVVANAYGVAFRSRKFLEGYAEARGAGFCVVQRPVREDAPKDIDTWMLADILESLFQDRIDAVLIGSGDSDFSPAAVIARRLGKQVVVASFAGSLSASLLDEATGLLVLTGPSYATEAGEETEGWAQVRQTLEVPE